MDRPIDKRARNRRLARRLVVPLACVGAVALALLWINDRIRPTLSRHEIRTGVVERGPVEATITAGGTVLPRYEHVLTSPIDTRVTRILLTPGAEVEAGEPVVKLDVGGTIAALEKLDSQIALKENQREREQLEHAREASGLRTRREIKALELQSCEFEAERARGFLDDGLFSSDEVRRAEIDAERARMELSEIDESLRNLESALETRLAALDLEIAILHEDRVETRRRLELATARSDRSGVLTWIVPSEGMAIRRGDELARIADLSAFRVEATVSDVHAARLAAGLPVTVRSGEHRLSGHVVRVQPRVDNGIVTLDVELQDPSAPFLRQNLRVDVQVIVDRVENALRVMRGSYMTPDGTHAAFVLREEVAVRTPVRFGITNIDYYEILEGLEEGDEIIVSDMSDYMHLSEVRLR
jgi:HlyD family secretion protein